jgi:hypothetical protein
VWPRHCRTKVVPIFSTPPGSKERAPFANSAAKIRRRRCKARVGPPLAPLLQLVDDTPDDQIATEPQRRAGVMQCPPSMPQLLRRPIDQLGNLAIKRRAVRISRPVLPAAVCTETGERLARVLASRSVVDWKFHRLAGSAMRYTRPRSSLTEVRVSPSFFFRVPEKTPRTV